jgi:sugar/nucleoside kinase (ribokinase family)
MLCCIGDLVEDVVVWPSREPRRGTDTPSRVYRRRGGSAANVAVLAAQAGERSRFVGQVGADRLGGLLVNEIESTGVEALVAREGRTGTIVILVESDGERTMLPDRGAATQLDDIPAGAMEDVTWLHVPGYSLIVEPLSTTAHALVAEARNRNVPVSIDASSTGLIEEFGIAAFSSRVSQLEPDILFCNKDEATQLGVGPGSPLDGARLSVVKAGPHPVLLIEPDGSLTEVPVPPVAAVADTTGAGDAFAAGFLVATMGGARPVDAVTAANRLAATVLLRPGAGEQGQLPSRRT